MDGFLEEEDLQQGAEAWECLSGEWATQTLRVNNSELRRQLCLLRDLKQFT